MSTFNNQTNGNHSPVISGNKIQGDLNLYNNIEKNSKKFIDCSDKELLDYGLELAERSKKEKAQKRKKVIISCGKLFLFLLFLWLLAFLYTIVNSQDKHILDIANFFCGSVALLLAIATFLGLNKPNITEKDYMDTANNLIRELNFRQNKNYSDRVYRAFKK